MLGSQSEVADANRLSQLELTILDQ